MITFQNFHKHTYWSNIKVADSATSLEDYCKRAVELGHGIISSVEHGWQGHYIECHQLAEKYGLKFVFGTEAYWVKDRLALDENGHKDGKNCHIVLIAMNENGRQAINDILSQAAIDGYYRQSRIDLELIMSLPADDVVVTSACFLKGNRVLTNNGYVNIEDIKCGDKVVNRYGQLEDVNFPTAIMYNGTGYSISTNAFSSEIKCTADHKYLVINREEIRKGKTPYWCKAEDIYKAQSLSNQMHKFLLYPLNNSFTNDCVISKSEFDGVYKPIINHWCVKQKLPDDITITPELMRFFGAFIGNGYISVFHKNDRVGISFNSKEFETCYNDFVNPVEQQLGIKFNIIRSGNCNKVEISTGSIDVVNLFYWLFGNCKAESKHIPNRLLHISYEFDCELLYGLCISDGSFQKISGRDYVNESYRMTYCTTSEKLKEDFRSLCCDLGLYSTIYSKKEYTDKKGVCHKSSYFISIISKNLGKIKRGNSVSHSIVVSTIKNLYDNIYRSPRATFDGIEYLLLKITSMDEIIINEEVYCLNNNTHSFVCEFATVHNCIAGWHYEDADSIFLRMKEHFGNNFYLEVQYHNTEPQKRLNKHILKLKKQYGFQIIMGCDSHYIDEKGALDRDEFIKSKGMNYPDEEGWYMDYPDGETAYKRFVEQCVLSHNEIVEAMENTNRFLEVEEYDCPIFNHDIKMPTLYPDLTQQERDDKLEELIWDKWSEYKKEVPTERHSEYEEQIRYELDIVKKTFHSDYFLLDYAITQLGKKKGGQLTLTGRGSGVSFFLNRLLGFTSVDRISAKVKMYPERFMSPTRILETHSLADIDMNVARQEPFWEAQEELLGYEHSKQMIAFQQLKPSAAWKMYAKSQSIDFETANQVSDQIKKYIKAVAQADEDEKDDIDVLDYIDEQYKDIYLKSTDYLGVVSSVSPHPCFDGEELVNTAEGLMPIKNICVGDMVLTKENEYKMVTNTFVTEDSPIGILNIQGRPTIKVTPNHPFLCKHMTRGKGNYREFSEDMWVNAEDLRKDDFVCVGTINNQAIPYKFQDVPTNNETFWWIVGRYLGDGWLKKFYYNRTGEFVINICCSFDELNEITDKLDQLNFYKYWVSRERTTYRIYINDKNLYYFLWQFGKGAANKFVPNFVIDMPKNLVTALVEGYLSADGCIRPNAYTTTTISKKLALTMSQCITKVYGTYVGVRAVTKKDNYLEGRLLKGNTQYLSRFHKTRCQKDYYYIDKQNRIWVRFRSYEMLNNTQTVYNFEVEDSHTYCVNDIIVHNCASLVYEGNIRKEIGYIFVKSASNEGRVCCCMDGKWAEKYGFLKNDWLKVNVVEVIYKIFERIGIEPFSSTELIEKCENDEKTWSLYKKQCTDGLNQVEQPSSSTKVGAYAPKNISELTAFVAAVRPGFKSMYDVFESREHFEYNIPAFDKLLQTEEMPNSFVLYQEQAMLTLNYAGIPMSECYAVIKAISKKRVEEITKNKDIFLQGFSQKIADQSCCSSEIIMDTALRVWQIIEDGSRYSFNASHAYSVALDSLYEAWLKAHHPLEFYETYLNILNEKGDKDRLNKFKDEAEHYFNILFPPYRFRQDNRSISIDKEHNAINNALSSIKGYSNAVAEALYECGNNTSSFIDALRYLDFMSIKSAKIIPLIKIGYFAEFGNENSLLAFISYWDMLKQGNAKQVSKEKADDLLNRFLPKYSRGTNKDGSESKSWVIEDIDELLDDIYNYCIENIESPTYKEKMEWQKEVLDYIELTTNKPEDTKKIFILDVKPLIGQYSPNPWCYKVETRSIGTGRTATLNIDARTWEDYGELKPYDIITVGKVQKNKKGYWYLYSYRKEYK